LFAALLLFKHPQIFKYNFDTNLVSDYLRSQDIEDPKGLIKDRIFISDSDIYLASGYLYAKGASPTSYNFQHPPLVKYLYGFSTLLSNNPYWIQILFGLGFLLLTYFLASKVIKNKWLTMIPPGLLLLDPLFGTMMKGGYLDLGQAFFALLFVILAIYYPNKYILSGLVLGFFAASKFWSTAVIFVILTYAYKLFIKKEKVNIRKTIISFIVAFLTFSLTYIKAFVDSNWTFNIFSFLATDLKFMLSHNSAGQLGGSIILFITGFFSPWWKEGFEKAGDWSFLWPIGLVSSIILAIRSKLKNTESFFLLLPTVYLLLISTGVPFTRYFLIILPFIYIGLVKLFFNSFDGQK